MRNTRHDGQTVQTEPVGCLMTLINGYVVESHVSAWAVKRLLSECPAIKGLSLPDMPVGSPGMGGGPNRLSLTPSAPAIRKYSR